MMIHPWETAKNLIKFNHGIYKDSHREAMLAAGLKIVLDVMDALGPIHPEDYKTESDLLLLLQHKTDKRLTQKVERA